MIDPTDLSRFWSKVERAGLDDCWAWTGRLDRHGYGDFWMPPSGHAIAHRIAYEIQVGPIPDGLVIDHTCHTQDPACTLGPDCPHRACMNAAHMELVTAKENTSRRHSHGSPQWKTCKRGHPLVGDNVSSNGPNRTCKTCRRIRAREYAAQH